MRPTALLLALLPALTLAQNGAINPQNPFGVDWRTLTSGPVSNAVESGLQVVDSEMEWPAVWNRLTGRPLETAPKGVDWMQKRLVIVALGKRNTGGFSVFVRNIRYAEPGLYVIEATERTPAPGGWVSRRATAPFTVVQVDRKASRFVLDIKPFEPDPVWNPWGGGGSRPPRPPMETFRFHSLQSGLRSRMAQPSLYVADDRPTWERIAQNAFGSVPEEFGDVDWSRERIVLVGLGERRTGGYSVAIRSITLDPNGQLVVEAAETSPARGAIVTQALTYPWVAVKVARTAGQPTLRIVPAR